MTNDERMLLSDIAERFFRDVYYPVSLCIAFGEDGCICEAFQFDTLHCAIGNRCVVPAERIWLLSNHPDGSKAAMMEDKNNLMRIRKENANSRCQLAIYSEYDGLLETNL